VALAFAELVATSAAVAAVGGRLEKIDRLAALLARLSPDEVGAAVAFLTGSTRQGRLGVGGAAIREARLTPPAARATLTLVDVDRTFDRVAALAGAGSARARKDALGALFGSATEAEQDFLTRLLFGELRQGAQEGVLIDAVAKAAHVPSKSLRRGVMMAGDLLSVAAAVLAEGEAGLSRFRVRVFTPVQPMLADTAEDVQAAVASLDDAAVEYKLDGARIQVHKDGDEVKVYSRALREVTPSVPEVVEQVRALPARSLILDGEVLALRPDGSPWPFQDTMRRFGRRLDVDAMRRELPLRSFFFDVLALDDRELVDEPQATRFGALQAALPASLVIPHTSSPSPHAAQAFLDAALAQGHEGVMVKLRSSPYAAGSRGSAWLKVKAVRTLDLVVLAAEWGNGRRQGWLSNLHLGARDPEHGGFVMLGKTFKGLTDELLAWQTEQFLARELTRDAYIVYVRPELVVEIAFNDIQVSPHYPGGLALRFARVKRYRSDKTAEQADTIDTVRRIHRELTRAT
jgi:DNA ligase-1